MKVIYMDPAPAPGPRSCGTCSVCCKVFAFEGKEQNVWCQHAKKGRGCGIYGDRPQVCRHFRCLWLDGNLLPEHRPDKIHGVVVATLDGQNLTVHEDPGYPGVASRALMPVIEAYIANAKNYVVVVTGERRRVIAHPELVPRLEAMMQAERDRVMARAAELGVAVDEKGDPK